MGERVQNIKTIQSTDRIHVISYPSIRHANTRPRTHTFWKN